MRGLYLLSILAIAVSCGVRRPDTSLPAESLNQSLPELRATDYPGIYNDGQAINRESFNNLLFKSNGHKLYWPSGIYEFERGATNIDGRFAIDWYGEGANTILQGFSDLGPAGNVQIENLKFRKGGIIIRWDNLTGITDTVEEFRITNVYLTNCRQLIRNVGPDNEVWARQVTINGLWVDSIAVGGAVFQYTAEPVAFDLRNITVRETMNGTYVPLIRIETTGGVDDTLMLNNISFEDVNVEKSLIPDPTSVLLLSLNYHGGTLLASDITIRNCNLPMIDIRGTPCNVVLDNWQVNCSTNIPQVIDHDYFLINKSRQYNEDWAFQMLNSNIYLGGNIGGIYFENEGNRLIRNSVFHFNNPGQNCIRFQVNEPSRHQSRMVIENSRIINSAEKGKMAFWIQDDVPFFTVKDSYIQGEESIYGFFRTGKANSAFRFSNTTFEGGFQSFGKNRGIARLIIDSCEFLGVDHFNFSSMKESRITNNQFKDSENEQPGARNLNFEFGRARKAVFSANHFDLENAKAIGTVEFEYYDKGLDSLFFNQNTGSIIVSGNICYPIRLSQAEYLEVSDNKLTLGQKTLSKNAALILITESVGKAVVKNNELQYIGKESFSLISGEQGSRLESLIIKDNSGAKSEVKPLKGIMLVNGKEVNGD